jgi:hypothetical protein
MIINDTIVQFYSSTVPRNLAAVAPEKRLVLHVQDSEALAWTRGFGTLDL